MADFTKSQGQVLDWNLLDDVATDNPVVKTPMQTKPDELEVDLNIVVAHRDTNDAAANYVTVTVLVRAGADAEGWRKLVEYQAGGGQAVTEALNAASGASEGNPERLQVAATGDWDTGLPEWVFLLDNGNLVDSCLCLIEGWADNDYYINAWDLIRDYDNADALFDGVDQNTIRIPAGFQYFMVIFHNSDGTATYAVKVDYGEVTDIE